MPRVQDASAATTTATTTSTDASARDKYWYVPLGPAGCWARFPPARRGYDLQGQGWRRIANVILPGTYLPFYLSKVPCTLPAEEPVPYLETKPLSLGPRDSQARYLSDLCPTAAARLLLPSCSPPAYGPRGPLGGCVAGSSLSVTFLFCFILFHFISFSYCSRILLLSVLVLHLHAPPSTSTVPGSLPSPGSTLVCVCKWSWRQRPGAVF